MTTCACCDTTKHYHAMSTGLSTCHYDDTRPSCDGHIRLSLDPPNTMMERHLIIVITIPCHTYDNQDNKAPTGDQGDGGMAHWCCHATASHLHKRQGDPSPHDDGGDGVRGCTTPTGLHPRVATVTACCWHARMTKWCT